MKSEYHGPMDVSTKRIERIKQNDKIEQILSVIHDRIINGELQPGMELPSEKEFSEQLGVSRFSLREALRVAQAQGLVEINQGRRPTVAYPSAYPATAMMKLVLQRTKKPLFDLVAARAALECKIVRMAAQKIADSTLMEIEENIKLMEIEGRDLDYYVKKDTDFHGLILHSVDSMVFEIMLSSVNDLIRESRVATLQSGGIARAYKAHWEIFEALKAHDPDLAEIKMNRHLMNAEEDLKALGYSL